MPEKVYLSRQADYNVSEIKARLNSSFEALDVKNLVAHGSRVLLKPNLLMAVSPERHITTHPAVVEAVVELLLDYGAKCAIGDSPGVENTKHFVGYQKTLELCGIAGIAKRYGVETLQFSEDYSPEQKPKHIFHSIRVAKELLDFDAIVNIPKLKTHVQTQLTLCTKNMFGCVVGALKPQWHLSAGRDHRTFARVITEIYSHTRPSLNILDGIYGMEGDGPTNGRARQLALLGVSRDGVALDRVIASLVGLDPADFHVLAAAQEIGCGETDLDNIELLGEAPGSFDFSNFELPGTIAVTDMGPAFLRPYITDMLTPKITIFKTNCVLCGSCVDVCPADALEREPKQIIVDHQKCIRCYCCHEMCPHDAVRIKEGLLARLLKVF